MAEDVPEHHRVGVPRRLLESIGGFSRSRNFGVIEPAAARPDRSPLTSARNTGTPSREKLSASTCSVTVLPVPVAPVIKP